MTGNVFQAEAVPVVCNAKFTNVQRDAKIEKIQAGLLIGVIASGSVSLITAFNSS